MFSAFNPSKLKQWAADDAAPGEQLGVRCLAQGSHLSRGHFLPEQGFEPTTLDYLWFQDLSESVSHQCSAVASLLVKL